MPTFAYVNKKITGDDFIKYMVRKKIVVLILVMSIIFSCSTPINAQQADNSNSLASVSDSLNKLGLLSGDGNGNYNLDSTLKRTEAMTFLAKLMGKNEYIQNNKDTLKKTKFKDVAETDWFAPYVGFCYSNGIVSGYGNDFFGSKDNTTEQAFLVMLLKLLKHDDIKWNDNVFKKAYEIGLVADTSYLSKTKDSKNSFTRGGAVSTMNTALTSKINGQNNSLLQALINEGAVNADIAKSLGYEIDPKTDTATDIAVKIDQILVVSSTEISVALSTEIKSVNKSNILIYEAGNKNNTLNIASVTTSGNNLKISTGTQVPGKSYNVELINIKDSKGNILTGLTGSFSGFAQIIMPPSGSTSPPPPANDPLSVNSITAINAKQIQIVFNKAMNEASVTDISFYEIKDKGTEIINLAQGAVIYNELTKTVVITLNNKISDRLTNLTTAKVTVKKGIKAIDGSELATNIGFNTYFEDFQSPKFLSAEATGVKTIRLTFSEPIYCGINTDNLAVENFSVSIDDNVYSVQKAKLSDNTITLSLEKDLLEGHVTVVVNTEDNGISDTIRDYADNRVIKTYLSFYYGYNPPPPPAIYSISALNAKQIIVKFNVAMDTASIQNISFYEIKDKGSDVISLASGAIQSLGTKTALITLNNNISDKLTNGTTAKVNVKKGIKAATGETISINTEFDVPVLDITAPFVSRAGVIGEKTIVLTFLELVYGGANTDILNTGNFRIKSDTDEFSVQNAKLSGNTITLTSDKILPEGELYVTINAAGTDASDAIQDYAGNKVPSKNYSFTYSTRISAKALSLNQIEVRFVSEMNRAAAENIIFYEVKDKGTDIISISPCAISYIDSTKTAVITLNDKLTNNTTAKLVIKKGIKTASGESVSENMEIDIPVSDTIVPYITTVDATGEKTIRLTFTEPVYDGSNKDILDIENFSVKHFNPKYVESAEFTGISLFQTFSYTVQKAELSGNTITLTLAENLVEGIISVTVNALGTGVSNPIQDYAGNISPKCSIHFNYIKTGSNFSQVTVKKAEENVVTLSFSKPVTAKDLKLFHTDKNIAANMSTPVSIDEDVFVNEITFKFSTKIPTGTTNFFLVNGNDPSCKMFNIYGEYVPDQTLVSEVVVDKEAPYVTATAINYNSYHFYKIYFNEEINTTVAMNSASYSFKTADDNLTIFFVPEMDDDNKSVKLNIPYRLLDNTKYKVVVKNAEDLFGNKIASDITFTFTTSDFTVPSVERNKCFTINSDGKIIIYFSEPMNEAQMLDKANYMVATTQGAIYASLGTEDTVSKLSDRSVILDLSTEVNLPNVKISSITDLSGKSLYASNLPVYLYAIDKETVKVKSADLIAKNKVKITFNCKLDTYSSADIKLTGVTEGAIRIQHVESIIINEDGNTEAVLVLDKDLSTDVKYNGYDISLVTKDACSSESVFGTKLSPSQSVDIRDKVAPEVITYDHDSNDLTEPVEKVVLSGGDILNSMVDGKVPKDTTGTITISYSEEIHSFSVMTYIVEGYTVTAVSNAANDSEVVLSIKANSDNTPARTTVRQVYSIYDYEYNYLLPDKAWTVR